MKKISSQQQSNEKRIMRDFITKQNDFVKKRITIHLIGNKNWKKTNSVCEGQSSSHNKIIRQKIQNKTQKKNNFENTQINDKSPQSTQVQKKNFKQQVIQDKPLEQFTNKQNSVINLNSLPASRLLENLSVSSKFQYKRQKSRRIRTKKVRKNILHSEFFYKQSFQQVEKANQLLKQYEKFHEMCLPSNISKYQRKVIKLSHLGHSKISKSKSNSKIQKSNSKITQINKKQQNNKPNPTKRVPQSQILSKYTTPIREIYLKNTSPIVTQRVNNSQQKNKCKSLMKRKTKIEIVSSSKRRSKLSQEADSMHLLKLSLRYKYNIQDQEIQYKTSRLLSLTRKSKSRKGLSLTKLSESSKLQQKIKSKQLKKMQDVNIMAQNMKANHIQKQLPRKTLKDSNNRVQIKIY